MTLQSSGAITLQDIEDEFGGTGSISISEYYGADSGVPGSGTISFSDFYGTSSVIDPEFNAGSYSSNASSNWSGGGDVTATAGFRLTNSGTISGVATNSGTAASGSWTNNGTVTESDFEGRMLYVSGSSLDSGSQNTWLNLGTTRYFGLSITEGLGGGSKSGTWTAQIRPAGGGSVIDSATVTLSAEVIDSFS